MTKSEIEIKLSALYRLGVTPQDSIDFLKKLGADLKLVKEVIQEELNAK
jgi:hypothetical protein